ncbi:hypothetical protein N9L71_07200 [Verrucomicrobiales bacterium]|jgi:hypothetical protein|nr:hypothetical protein [Verrucomicrobiales bacterium]
MIPSAITITITRKNPTGKDTVSGAIGLQYQQQLSERPLFQIGGFDSLDDDGDKRFGVRTELQREF